MPQYLYRFRPLERLLNNNELERQEIFFAAPSALNDPMEGYLDIFWRGDRILWTNLFRNYLLCLYHCFILVRLGAERLSADDIPVFISKTNGHPPFINAAAPFIQSVLHETSVAALVELLGTSAREIRRDELLFYLRIIHTRALAMLSNITAAEDKKPGASFSSELNSAIEKLSKTGLPEFSSSVGIEPERLFSVFRSVDRQMELLTLLTTPPLMQSAAKSFLLLQLPYEYLTKLERLIFPKWYTACFLEEISNPSLWGHYGSSHTGVCLQFKTAQVAEGKCGLRLDPVSSWSSSKDGKSSKRRHSRVIPFEKVSYDAKFPSIDFFRSLGRLPWPVILEWFSDGSNNYSACWKEAYSDEESWRRAYWRMFSKGTTVKMKEWSHELEHRLILSSSVGDLDEVEDRILHYGFADLAGIVFGIKTPLEAKLKILKIIERKCDENRLYDVKFFQAEYAHHSGSIEIHPMRLIKVRP